MDEALRRGVERKKIELMERVRKWDGEADREAIQKLVSAFRQNTQVTGLPEIVTDAQAFFFADFIMHECTKQDGPIEFAADVPEGMTETQVRLFNAYNLGIMVGVYLAEIGRASLILREGK
jgi:hypothetical protein